jgi:hypothetical protein
VTGNTAASVRGRLTNRAKAGQRPFQEVLQHYALQRLLYRLAQSPHRGRFLLKGALLLNAWHAPVSRPVNLGTLNTRMKDFFDIWLLASQYDFTGPALA